jgi:hypothetical protein
MDSKLEAILTQLKKFGFEFYGHDEGGKPLVTAPNGQVTEINLAINFVNKQMQEQKDAASSSGGNFEAPVMNQNIDTNVKVERSVEVSLETKLESEKEEKKTDGGNTPQKDVQVKKVAPNIQLAKPKVKPFGDGFDPKSFDFNNIDKTLEFIKSSSKKKNTSSDKWVAEQFKKFLEEIKTGNLKL